jgi:hypothetical protein
MRQYTSINGSFLLKLSQKVPALSHLASAKVRTCSSGSFDIQAERSAGVNATKKGRPDRTGLVR